MFEGSHVASLPSKDTDQKDRLGLPRADVESNTGVHSNRETVGDLPAQPPGRVKIDHNSHHNPWAGRGSPHTDRDVSIS